MRRSWFRVVVGTVLLLTAIGVRAQEKAAKELEQQALAEPDQVKAVEMLCRAADMAPKNQEYRNTCNTAKRTKIDSDRNYLKTAQDDFDAGKMDGAKRYAKYVTKLDPELYQQAQQLLAKLNGGSQPAVTPPVVPSKPDPSLALMGQAQNAFDAGNLAAAKTAAQGVTEANIKSTANHMLADIENYYSSVSAGRRAEEANQYQAALSSYEAAQRINSHVSADDLSGRIARLGQQMASAAKPPPPTPGPVSPPPGPVARNVPPVAPTTPKVETPEEKKKKLMDAFNGSMGRKDLEGAERALKQVVQLDTKDMDAKARLADVEKQLAEIVNRDPVKLEKTLRDAIVAFYASSFEDAESDLNRYIGADSAKKKGVAYFYLGATAQARALLEAPGRQSSRRAQAQGYFKQARAAGYQPVPKYVSEKILDAWQHAGM